MDNASTTDINQLIERTIEGDNEAREAFFAIVQRRVMAMPLWQLGPYCRDPDYVAEVCARVVIRFLQDDYRRLREYLKRPQRGFWSWLNVIVNRVAIDLARSMKQNIAARSEDVFRWVQEVEFMETDKQSGIDPRINVQVIDLNRYLTEHANPTDVALLKDSIHSSETWIELGRRYNLTPANARQRVRRLRNSLRDWLQRASH